MKRFGLCRGSSTDPRVYGIAQNRPKTKYGHDRDKTLALEVMPWW